MNEKCRVWIEGKEIKEELTSEEQRMLSQWKLLREEDQKLVQMLMGLLIRPVKKER